MKQALITRILFAVMTLLLSSFWPKPTRPELADLVLINGNICTVSENRLQAEALPPKLIASSLSLASLQCF